MAISPKHPLDNWLSKKQWARACLDDLGAKSTKLALRLVCRPVFTSRIVHIVDVNAWQNDSKVYLELAAKGGYPLALEQVVVEGIKGMSPLALGLVPCRHSPEHWNPLILPVIWQQAMNDTRHFNVLCQRFIKQAGDASWQCPDYAHASLAE